MKAKVKNLGLMAVFACLSMAVAAESSVVSRYGTLTTKLVDPEDDYTGAERNIFLNGKKIPSATTPYDLEESVERVFQFEEKDVFLITSSFGGAACPATFRFITVSPHGATSTEDFGTCSDILEIENSGSVITVKMPVFNSEKEEYESFSYHVEKGLLTSSK